MRRPRLRLSIRTRLAIGLGAGMFVMGLATIGVSYWLVDRSLGPQQVRPAVARFVKGPPPGTAGGGFALISGTQASVDVPSARPGDQIFLQGFAADLRARTMQHLVVAWAEVLGPMVVASALLGWLLATRLLRPLRSITSVAQRLSAESLDQRLALSGPRDELRDLADTFDAMLGRLDAAFASQRRFVANASHELRTPLAIMRAQVDVALSDSEVTRGELLATARVVSEAVGRCQRLLDGLLLLARSDRGLEGAEPADLAEVAARALAGVSPTSGAAGVAVRATLCPAAVRGDPALLERLVGNLLENALAYNRPSGWVEVHTGRIRDHSVVRVANSGPSVPPAQVDGLFEPFRRLSRDRTGSGRSCGLGLSIVRAVARTHGGEAGARALPEGGLEVTVRLPVGAEAGEPARAVIDANPAVVPAS
jgi:signal transduction histidine kinase